MTIVDNPSFREFARTLDRKFKMPGLNCCFQYVINILLNDVVFYRRTLPLSVTVGAKAGYILLIWACNCCCKSHGHYLLLYMFTCCFLCRVVCVEFNTII